MNIKPVLSRITIYPIKSLDGISLKKAVIIEGGCLMHDREFALFDEMGDFIIGKTNSRVHSLRTNFDIENNIVSFRKQNESTSNSFHLLKEKKAIENYLSAHFDMPVRFERNSTGRFMDIPDMAGLTVISTASLEEVSKWYSDMDVEETRKRFRATIEIEGVPAFWEDHLFSDEGKGIEFKIGDVTVIGISPRDRCVVPTRNPENGEVLHGFPKSFSKHRLEKLPSWSTLKSFGHSYFLTVNCSIPKTEIGKNIAVGDEVLIVGASSF